MTIQDAIKTGKPFKTPEMNDYLHIITDSMTGHDYFHWLNDNTRCNIFPVKAILSNNWSNLQIPDNIVLFPNKRITTKQGT